MTRLPAISCGLLLTAAFGVSLFFTGVTNIAYAPAMGLVIAAALLTIITSLRNPSLPTGPAALLFLGFFLYVTLSLSWSTVPFVSLVTYLIMASCPLIFLTMLLPADRDGILKHTGGFLLLALGGLGLWALTQYLFLQPVYGPRAHHPLPDPNSLASLMLLGALPAIGLLLVQKPGSRAFYGLLALSVILCGGLIATQSRGGLLCFFIGLAFVIWPLRDRLRDKKYPLMAAAAVLLVFMIVGGLSNPHSLFHRLQYLFLYFMSQPGVLSRLALWESAWAMLRDHVWTGTGLGTFYLYYPSYRLPLKDDSAGSWVHTDPLQFGAEMGVMAPVLFYLFVAALIYAALKASGNGAVSALHKALTCGVAAALLAVFLHAHISFAFYLMPVLIVCAVWVAGLYALAAPRGFIALNLANLWQKTGFAVCALAILSCLALMTVTSAAGFYLTTRAETRLKSNDIGGFLNSIEKARLYAPASFTDPQVRLARLYASILEKPDALFSKEEQGKMRADTLDMLKQAEEMNPARADINYTRGLVFAASDEKSIARAQWETALRKDPAHSMSRLALARLLVAAGEVAAANDLVREGMIWPRDRATNDKYKQFLDETDTLAHMQRSFNSRQVAP